MAIRVFLSIQSLMLALAARQMFEDFKGTYWSGKRHDDVKYEESDVVEGTFGDKHGIIYIAEPIASKLSKFSDKSQEGILKQFEEVDNQVKLAEEASPLIPDDHALRQVLPFTPHHLFRMSFNDGYGGCEAKDTRMTSTGEWDFMGCEMLYAAPQSGPWATTHADTPFYIGFVAHFRHHESKKSRLVVVMRPTIAVRSTMVTPFIKDHLADYRNQDVADIQTGTPVRANPDQPNGMGILVHSGIWSRVQQAWPGFCNIMARLRPTQVVVTGLSLGAATGSLFALQMALEARKGSVCQLEDDVWGPERSKGTIPLAGIFISPFPVVRYESGGAVVGLEDNLKKLVSFTTVKVETQQNTVQTDPIFRMFGGELSCLEHLVVAPLSSNAEEAVDGGHLWHYDCRKGSWVKEVAHPPLEESEEVPHPPDAIADNIVKSWLTSTAETSPGAHVNAVGTLADVKRSLELFNRDGLTALGTGHMSLHCGDVCLPALDAWMESGFTGLEDLEE